MQAVGLKLAENKAGRYSLDSKLEKWANRYLISFWRNRHSLISERICEKHGHWDAPLSLCLLLSLMQVRNKVPPYL